MRYERELKERVTLKLQSMPHGSQILTAKLLHVTPRTIRSWKKQICRHEELGRKKTEITFLEKIKIAREWVKQGYPGSRPIIKALPTVRVRAIREVVSQLKSKRKIRIKKIKSNLQKSIRVHRPGSVVSLDGATISKGQDYLIHKDRASLKIYSDKCESNLNASDTIKVLEKMKTEKRLPLVLCTDNGSPLCAQEVLNYLNNNYIVHLKNLPRVPQHNGACENAVREFKDVFIENFDENKTLKSLNEYRKRKSLNWLTANEFERKNNKEFDKEFRLKFYMEVKKKIVEEISGIENALEKRKKEREVILKTMEEYSLIKIKKGNQPLYVKAEEIA